MIPAKKLEPPTLVSWWLQVPQVGFTAFVEKEEWPRMRVSRFGQSGLAKPLNTDPSN